MSALARRASVGLVLVLVPLAFFALLGPLVSEPPPIQHPPAAATGKASQTPAPEPVVLTRPTARFGSLQFRLPHPSDASVLSADGKVLVTAGDRAVVVWDTETGERKHVFRDCDVPIGFGSGWMKIALSADGCLLAQASFSEVQIRVWDLTTGKQVAGFGTNPLWRPGPGGVAPIIPAKPPAERITHFAFSADSKELVLCGPAGARVVQARTGVEVRYTPWTTDPAQLDRTDPVAVTRDGRLCLTTGGPEGARTLTLRDIGSGKAEPEFALPAGHAGYGDGITFSADGKRIGYIVGLTVQVWDLPVGKPARVLQLPSDGFCSLAFSHDNRVLFVGSSTGQIVRYELETEKELPALTGHKSSVTGLHPTPDDKRLVSAGWDNRVRRFDLETGKELPVADGYDQFATVAGAPDGSLFAIAGWNGRLDVFSSTGKLVRNLQASGSVLQRLAFTPDGQTLAAYDHAGKIRFWNARDWTEREPLPLALPANERFISPLAFSADGMRLLIGTPKGILRCWDLAAHAELWQQPAKDPNVVVFSPDGAHALSAGWDKTINWRNPRTGETRRAVNVEELVGPGPRYVNSIAFEPNGHTFLTAHHDATIRRWDTDTGKLLATLSGHAEVVWPAQFSPDGKWIASGSIDRTVRIWEAASGVEVCRLTGHDSSRVLDGSWGPAGRTIVTSSGSEAVLWDLRPTDLVRSSNHSALWDDLIGDPVTAYRAQWSLLDNPNAAATLFRDRQAPAKAPDDENQIEKLIADLDSDTFRTREQSMKALRESDKPFTPYLRRGLKTAGAEGRKRITELLAELTKGPTANELRQLRAIQVLELAGTPEAIAVLKEWAGGSPGELLTEEASAAVKRIASRR